MAKKNEGIPFHQYIDDIQAIEQNPLNRCMLVMEFYKKINLITHLSGSNNRMIFAPIIPEVIDMLQNTLKYLSLEYKLEKQETNYLLLALS